MIKWINEYYKLLVYRSHATMCDPKYNGISTCYPAFIEYHLISQSVSMQLLTFVLQCELFSIFFRSVHQIGNINIHNDQLTTAYESRLAEIPDGTINRLK